MLIGVILSCGTFEPELLLHRLVCDSSRPVGGSDTANGPPCVEDQDECLDAAFFSAHEFIRDANDVLL